jgi:hypothetical protein
VALNHTHCNMNGNAAPSLMGNKSAPVGVLKVC